MGDVLSIGSSGTSTGGDSVGGLTRSARGSEQHQHAPPEHQLRATRVRIAATGAGQPSGGTGNEASADTDPLGTESGFVESSSDGVKDA